MGLSDEDLEFLDRGKDITPFLLDYVVKAAGADCLKSNVQLVWNNCRLAAKIAADYRGLTVK